MARLIIPTIMLAAAASAQFTSIAGLPTDANSLVGGITSGLDSLVSGLTATSTSGSVTSATATGPTIQVPQGQYTAGISGSVISAAACGTTYAVHCTDAALCVNTDLTVTATIAPSSQVVNYGTSVGGTSALAAETCIISASSIATCALAVILTTGTTVMYPVQTTYTTTLTYYGLPVQSNYVAPTGTCSSAATPTLGGPYTLVTSTSSKGAAPTQAAIYKAGVPVLAAAAVWAAL